MKIGTIILAAGLGTRLGKGVKALVKVGNKTLLERLVEKSGEHIIVLTSEATDQAIATYVQNQKWDHVAFVKMPSIAGVPIGNCAVFRAVASSEIYQKWHQDGITHVSVVPIDNPLAEPLDPDMRGGDLIVKAVEKQHPDEKIGSLVEQNGKIKVIEYFELSDVDRHRYMLGYAGMFVATMEFFDRAAAYDLPWHSTMKSGKMQKEKFLFDAFVLAREPKIVIKRYKDCFCPIKVPEDIAKAEKMLYTGGEPNVEKQG